MESTYEPLQPPSPEAVDRALQILLDSVEERNKHTKIRGHSNHGLLEEYGRDHSVLKVAHTALSTEALTRMAMVARRRNGLVPISKLPAELTADVLLRTINPAKQANLKHLNVLARVQTSWWRVIVSFPAFWTTIHTRNVTIPRLKLKKSGALPLDIFCDGCPSENDQRTLIAMLKKHRSRIRSFTYDWEEIGPAVEKLLASSMPILENLTLRPTDDDDDGEYAGIPRDSRLRRLEVRGTLPRWGPNQELSQLKELHWGVCSSAAIGPQEFSDALQSCGNLELLELEGIILHDEVRRPWQGQAIHLPSLRSLSMNEVDEDLAIPLITFIHSDRLETFIIHSGAETDAFVHHLLSCQQLPPCLSTILQLPTLKSVRLDINDNNLTIDGDMESQNGLLSFDLTWFGPWLRQLPLMPQLSFATCGTPLRLSVRDSDPEDEEAVLVTTGFHALDTLVSLHLHCGAGIASRVMDALKQHSSEGTENWWPCPRLEGIYVEDEMLEMEASQEQWEELADVISDIREKRNDWPGIANLTVYHCADVEKGTYAVLEDIRALLVDPNSGDD